MATWGYGRRGRASRRDGTKSVCVQPSKPGAIQSWSATRPCNLGDALAFHGIDFSLLSTQKGVSCSHSATDLSSCYEWILPHLFPPYSPSLPYEIAVWVFCLSPSSVLSLPDRRTSRLFPSFPSPSLPASLPVPSPLFLSARPPATFRVQLLANHYGHFAGVELGANTRTSPCFG